MIDILVELVKLFFAVIFQNMGVVFAHFGHAADMVEQVWRLIFAIRNFAQMKNRQPRCQILIIGGFFGNQVRCRFDDGFMDIFGTNAVIELDMGL